MPKTPWKSFSAHQPDRQYLALISYLPLKHYRALPKFSRFAFETMRQLASSKGLIGYSLEAQLLARKFWTLSVWEDQQYLTGFVHQIPHSRIMQALGPHMGKTQFVQWQVSAEQIPLNWSAAKARLSA